MAGSTLFLCQHHLSLPIYPGLKQVEKGDREGSRKFSLTTIGCWCSLESEEFKTDLSPGQFNGFF